MEEKNCLALYLAYYLARFNDVAYKNLGYKYKTKAHSELAAKLGVKPTTLKNMRDEFDPVFGHRVGWYQRPMIPSRIKVLQALENLDENHINDIVKDILNGEIIHNSEIHDFLIKLLDQDTKPPKKKYILRGPTGKAAENYFINFYQQNKKPVNAKLHDFREYGVGYDFKIVSNTKGYFIEVKGLSDSSGGILFTDKEWKVASEQREKYFLVIVKNLKNVPEIQFIKDPYSVLKPTKNLYFSLQVNWSVSKKELEIYG